MTDGVAPMGDRAGSDVRRTQALRDLADLERQVTAGEIDSRTAARLTRIYEAELAASLDVRDVPVRAPDPPGARRVSSPAHPPRPGGRRRLWAGTAVLVVGAVAASVLVTRSSDPRPPGGFVTGNVSADGGSGRDLASVTTEEMEAVVAANPEVVAMRLALVERYLDAGDVPDAHAHARRALDLPSSAEEHQRALMFAGWTGALLGSPDEGARLLEQSLTLAPGDRDATWFLANVRLAGLGDAEGAITLLEELLEGRMTAAQRRTVEARLAEARRVADAPSPGNG